MILNLLSVKSPTESRALTLRRHLPLYNVILSAVSLACGIQLSVGVDKLSCQKGNLFISSDVTDDLRYVSVKSSASISVLRQKIWHLLELPDFCEEVIVLKLSDVEIPLTEIRKGNDPHKPFVLEVWPPNNFQPFKHNMLTMRSAAHSRGTSIADCEQKSSVDPQDYKDTDIHQTIPTAMTTNMRQKYAVNTLPVEYKSSELSCRFSSTTLFKLPGRKNKDNFANILLKIQDDLATLTNKLSTLEDKITA